MSNLIKTPTETIRRYESGGTFTTITGRVGCGKTTLVRKRVLEHLALDHTAKAVVFTDKINNTELYPARIGSGIEIGTEEIVVFDDNGHESRLPDDALVEIAKAGRHVIVTAFDEPNRRKPFAAFATEDLDLLESVLDLDDGRARNLLAGVRAERNARTKTDPFWRDVARAAIKGSTTLDAYDEKTRAGIEAMIYSMRSCNDENS